MIDNSNLKQYREMFNHVEVTLEAVERHKGEVTINRCYYDSDALSVNFAVNGKKHLFKVEIDNSQECGYNFHLDNERIYTQEPIND